MFKTTKFGSALLLVYILASCSQVLQSVDLSINAKDKSAQDEFNVIEKTLTLQEALNLANTPYPRRVFENGQSGGARHIPEEVATNPSFPKFSEPVPYKVGIGDQLSIFRLVDNSSNALNPNTNWPISEENNEYKLGIGDALALFRLEENTRQIGTENGMSPENQSSSILSFGTTQQVTKSVSRIGSDGSVLLLEVGRLEAKGKSLNELRSEVRNIFIRNGISPRFQLEIESFESKRVYITVNQDSKVTTLTDRKLLLRDLLTDAGVGIQAGLIRTIKLQRDEKTYSSEIRNIFSSKFPDIQLQDRDHIFVEDKISNDEVQTSTVASDGTVIFRNIGKLKVENKTIKELQAEISKIRKVRSSTDDVVLLDVTDFNSKNALVIAGDNSSFVVKITNKIQLLETVLTNLGIGINNSEITRINLHRFNKKYQFTLSQLLDQTSEKVYLMENDKIKIERLEYRPNKVFVLGGINPTIVTIDPTTRQTLADILFTEGGVLKSSNAKRSEIYLLRGRNPVTAYHLNARNPTKLIVAEAMELRPNDILYVAEQPIISFNRTLATIIPLRILLRDIQNENIR